MLHYVPAIKVLLVNLPFNAFAVDTAFSLCGTGFICGILKSEAKLI